MIPADEEKVQNDGLPFIPLDSQENGNMSNTTVMYAKNEAWKTLSAFETNKIARALREENEPSGIMRKSLMSKRLEEIVNIVTHLP